MKAHLSAIALSTAASIPPATAADFTSVDLTPPLNWVVGPYLWPANIIAGYNDAVVGTDWTAATWDANILDACKAYTDCTSSITWQGINSGSTGGTYWYGYVFRGGPTDESFYVRDTDTQSNVTFSSAWTIVQ